ncbi:MAG: hypothetical protein KIG36_05820 [Eubacteriales bacterium]|nr:hypothetical protein [Eubacteriales bacterium]
MSKVIVEKVAFGGWNKCVRISNGTVELIVTTEVGPRIIRYGFIGGPNVMCEKEGQMGTKGAKEWQIYGGHRLWHSPEDAKRTYELDNTPVKYRRIRNGIVTLQPVEPWAQIEKQMEIRLDEEGTGVRIVHRLFNRGAWDVEMSVWAMSVLAPGGKEVFPQVRLDTGLGPNRSMTLWHYTKMNDKRVYWGDKYITLTQDKKAKTAFKVGTSNDIGWAAYFVSDNCFVKTFDADSSLPYPDNGCSFETYTCDFMVEMETLSPLFLVGPGEAAEHEEQWHLFEHAGKPSNDEVELEAILSEMITDREV